jgi:hypothetical protein
MALHTPPRWLFCLGLALYFILLANPVAAEAPAESAIVGMYTQRDVDSQAQLFILDDRTFCFTFTGGALDLVKAGRWEVGADGVIQLDETRVEQALYPVVVRNLDRLGPKRVGINFDGYSLSHAVSPVFALSKSPDLPASFRPIFPRAVDSWAHTYALPLLPPDQAVYLFIGDVEADAMGRPGKKLRIVQYKLEGDDAVRIGFNKLQAEPPYKFRGRLEGGVLYLDRDKFGTRRPMPPEMVAEVRAQCIAPILQGQTPGAAGQGEESLPKGVRELTPVRTFELDTGRIAGEPLFTDKTQSGTTATDDLEQMIDAERASLQSAHALAIKDADKVEAYLQLSQALAEKKGRIKIYLPLIGEQYAELLVATNVRGDFKLARRIFDVFVETMLPATAGLRNAKLDYNISVVASQGLILYGVQKDPDLPNVIFGKLLGKDFDIKTHKNRTLIYNLACYYALTSDKKNMLAAVAEVRSRGTPTEQFMKDKDFSQYWQDADFLRVVR